MGKKPIITYKKNDFVGLDMLKETHLGLTYLARNLNEIKKWFFTSEPLIWENHLNWYNNYKEKNNDIVFIIFNETDNRNPIGQVALYEIDYEKGIAEYGRCMIWDEKVSGQGYLEKASRLLMNISKNDLNINKWVLNVKNSNSKAIHVYEKLGFQKKSEEDTIIKMELVL